jgi:hypothetical protein
MKNDTYKLVRVGPKGMKLKVFFNDEQTLQDIIEFVQLVGGELDAFRNALLEKAASECGQKVPAWKLGWELSSGDTIILGRPLN